MLFLLGLAGLLFYPVMLLLAGGVMVASWRQLVSVMTFSPLEVGDKEGGAIGKEKNLPSSLTAPTLTLPLKGEGIMALLVLLAAVLFIFLKGAYPSGAHDFFTHYFTYYKEVIESGSLGPHASWYHYYYSKGLGLYFMSMILLDPFAVHLVGATFIFAAACMVFDFLRRPGVSPLLPWFGVLIYFLFYTYTRGRGLFAANGGWGDLEKTHELSAVMLLGCVWLARRALITRQRAYGVALCATAVALVIVFFASGLLAGLFFALLLAWRLLRKDIWGARLAFAAGATTGVALFSILAVNYLATGLPQDQVITYVWNFIDWRRVANLGYTLEFYAHLRDVQNYAMNTMPWRNFPGVLVEYYRLYLLWPILAVGIALFLREKAGVRAFAAQRSTSAQECPPSNLLPVGGEIALFLLATLLFSAFCGGRSQTASFFRYSSFNYAPMLVACLLPWAGASLRRQKIAVTFCLLALLPWVVLREPQAAAGWMRLGASARALNTGAYSIRDAVADQRGRAGRLKGGGVYPAMEEIYSALPAGTRVWSLHNHSYCLLPACNVQTYFSQVTSPRWYEIALGSVQDGKKIMQEEGLNFIFYSRSVPVVPAADARDQLAAFYPGLAPDHIADTFGILWTNGWDYLLTWKEESTAPLNGEFMDSWLLYHKNFIVPRKAEMPVEKWARAVKEAVEKNDWSRMPGRAEALGR